jgi:hypothetical protein
LKLITKLKFYISQKIKEYKNLRRTKKIGVCLFLVFIFNFQICSLISLSATLSFSQILSDIRLPSGFVNINLNIIEPENLIVQMPYEIDNRGMFYLIDITTTISINVNFLNKSNSVNITSSIFYKSSILPDVSPFSASLGFITGNRQFFNEFALSEMFDNSDLFEPKFYRMNISLSAVYFLGLIRFSFEQYNIFL